MRLIQPSSLARQKGGFYILFPYKVSFIFYLISADIRQSPIPLIAHEEKDNASIWGENKES
jgi:hypothetical protein